MLKVSVDGMPPKAAESVVVYDGDSPVAVVIAHSGGVYFADAARDSKELKDILSTLGVDSTLAHKHCGTITGEL
jgi:hypothetical protein